MVMQIPGRAILGGGQISTAPLGTPAGRLTPSTGVPVLTATVSAAGTVYYTPYQGSTIPIYNGSGWSSYAFSELSNVLANSATGSAGPAVVVANSNYDLFISLINGVLTLTRGPLWQVTATVTTPVASPGVVNWTTHGLLIGAPVSFSGGVLPTGIVAGTTYYVIAAGFTANAFEISATVGGAAINFTGSSSGTQTAVGGSDTVRGTPTALTLQNGIYVNTAAITNGPGAGVGTYVGTVRANATATVDMIFGGSATAGFLGVWNCYNRVEFTFQAFDATASWTYSSATVRQANASAVNQHSFIRGINEDAVTASYQQRVDTAAAAGAASLLSIQIDSTSTSGGPIARIAAPTAAVAGFTITVNYNNRMTAGFHFLSANEAGDGTNAATFSAGSGAWQMLQMRLRA